MWENIEYVDKQENKTGNWESKIRRVAWFEDMITFHQAWNRIPHSKLNNLLYDTQKDEFKVFCDNKDDSSKWKYFISAIQMFKTGILPAWEDEVNAKGSDFRLELKNLSAETMQAGWERLIFDMVTGNFPHVKEGISGVRFVQR